MTKTLLGALLVFSMTVFAQNNVDVLDSGTLEILDQPGSYSLATLLGVADQLVAPDQKLKQMRASELIKLSPAKFAAIATYIREDIKEITNRPGVPMAYSSEYAERKVPPYGNMPRFFDPYWMSAPEAAFALVAVVNRLDKQDFYPGTCGELRFIYRMAYYQKDKKGVETYSTLPLFLNVVFAYKKDTAQSCEKIAADWMASSADVNALMSGPLAKDRLVFKQVELNMQAVRYNSELKKDFGGQAVYLFRIFQEVGGRFAPIPLENTIDVAAVLADASLKKDLVGQLLDPANLQKIDNGTFVLENSQGRLLATRALSLTTSGRARLSNKPFTAVFGVKADDLSTVDFSQLKLVKTRAGLVERLNNSTCMGCHQSGGTAGFHMLGESQRFNLTFNRLVLPFSPHFRAERVRRQTYIESVAKGQAPETFRPLSFFGVQPGKARDLCLPDTTHFSAALGCREGLECVLSARNAAVGVAIGECVPKNNVTPGHVCRKGVITSTRNEPKWGDLYNLFGINDKIDTTKKFNAAGGCTVTEQGVPLGRISMKCDPNSKEGRMEFVDSLSDSTKAPSTMCAIQGGEAFDECARSANPPLCLENAKINRAIIDVCTPTRFCREDYICQQMPMDVGRQYKGAVAQTVRNRITKLNKLKIGFCVPNYFVFNMRADGHIVPSSRPASERP